MKKSSACFATLLMLSLVGAGCPSSILNLAAPSGVPSGPKPATFENLTPAQAAEKISFVGGNVIVMKQGFKGIAGQLIEKLGFGGGEGTREITIRGFAPAVKADLEWKLTARVPANPKDPMDSGIRQTTGAIVGANLLIAHKLYLPGYWVEGEQGSKDASVIWLSQDVFENLSKSKFGTLDFGILDLEQTGALKIAKDLAQALNKFKTTVEQANTKKDVYFIEADPEPSDWPLIVNGKSVTVQVIKARNWFGEIVVLNSKKNPLVLKVTLNPLAIAAVDSASGGSLLKYGLGYEITELKDIQE